MRTSVVYITGKTLRCKRDDHYLNGGVVAVQDGRVEVALDADVVACRK